MNMPPTRKTPTGSGKKRYSKSGKRKKPRKKVVKMRVGFVLATALALLLSLILFPLFRKEGSAESGAKIPAGNWRYGIDISHNNDGTIIWDSLWVMTDRRRRTVRDPYKAKEIKPVSFVFIKATEGATFKDRDFAENWKNAGRSGLRRGAYHFFRSSKDGEVQAKHFIATVGDLRFEDLPPVLDIETLHRGGSRKLLNERALQWLETIENHYRKKPIVYTGASFLKNYLSPEITERYPVWIAHYEKDSPDFEGWTWWQCTDKAVVAGVPGHVDLNLMRIE
jgi:lysozyme